MSVFYPGRQSSGRQYFAFGQWDIYPPTVAMFSAFSHLFLTYKPSIFRFHIILVLNAAAFFNRCEIVLKFSIPEEFGERSKTRYSTPWFGANGIGSDVVACADHWRSNYGGRSGFCSKVLD
jgi:hypothetical protein